VDDQITFTNTLVSNLLKRFRKTFGTAILTKGHDTVTKTSDYFIRWINALIHFLEQPFRTLDLPMRRDLAQPWDARAFVLWVGFES
jgi:hypothetical protein